MSRTVTVADVQTWNSKVFGLLMWTAGIVASSFRRRTDTSSLEHWKWNREREIPETIKMKEKLILLTSAKVSASVKPACATPSLSWSESLFTGNYGDNSQLPRQLENHTHPSPPTCLATHEVLGSVMVMLLKPYAMATSSIMSHPWRTSVEQEDTFPQNKLKIQPKASLTCYAADKTIFTETIDITHWLLNLHLIS